MIGCKYVNKNFIWTQMTRSDHINTFQNESRQEMTKCTNAMQKCTRVQVMSGKIHFKYQKHFD